MAITRRDFITIIGLVSWASFLKSCTNTDKSKDDLDSWQPAYARLEAEGKLAKRIDRAYEILEKCELCPNRCYVNRREGQRGFCRSLEKVMVYSHHPHFGEELPLVGQGGSGTIFFSNCSLRCVFCQNWPIAHEGLGHEVSDEQLADMMLDLQWIGCHNINLVTPTHVMPNIVNATRIALQKGLHLPLCYNTSGYERVENIKLLDGIVDIYLPDLKFMDGDEAIRYNFAAASEYPAMAKDSIIEMHRQVGDLVTNEWGVALRGLMVRHLVMPNRVAGTREFVKWVAENLSTGTYVNIMAQYRVEHKAFEYERIARAITPGEFIEAMEWALEAGLTNLDERSLANLDIYRLRIR
ncbi:MAG: radical SAM protein [Dehalococcoidales bacterium]|nr:MAG: radical SAM protein [Dehalococcoidales bacterium]